MDAFSQVLSSVKLEGALYFNAEFSAPWAFQSPGAKVLAPILIPGATHVMFYHFVLDGVAAAKLNDGEPVPLSEGDIVLFPHGDPHLLWAGDPTRMVDSSGMVDRLYRRHMGPMSAGGGGDTTRFVCGYLACDPRLCQSVLAGLPRVMRVSFRGDTSGKWLESSIRHLVGEAGQSGPGSEAMLAKLSEALLIDTLRRFMSTLPQEETGWLAAARDPIVGKALTALHTRVAEPWTLVALAKEVGLSRSSLAERFTRFLPDPPMAYLTRWRLQLAAKSLLSTPKSVSEIAAEVGYESEAAFNRAFKREFGQPPARFRKGQRSTSGAATQLATA